MAMKDGQAVHGEKPVQVVVNRQPVVLPDKEVTGAQIKAAAIEQGDTTVHPDSRLFRKEGEVWEQVPDDKTITVHEGERFRAQGKQEDS
jgi:Multiubiquitin